MIFQAMLKLLFIRIVKRQLCKKSYGELQTPLTSYGSSKRFKLFFSILLLISLIPLNVYSAPVSGSVCQADLLGEAQGFRAVDWNHFENAGATPEATINDTAIIASAMDEDLTNTTAYINAYDVLIDRAAISPTVNTSNYLSYTFTTTALAGLHAEIIGFGAAIFNIAPGFPDNQTTNGGFKVRIDIDDDPTFASPITLENNAIIDNLDVLNNNPNSNADLIENQPPERWLTWGYLHFDADTVIELQPNTTYNVRVYPYEDYRNGSDGLSTLLLRLMMVIRL